MKTQINTFIFFLLSFFLILISSCNEESDTMEPAKLRISMVDAPGDFDSLIITVEDVLINFSGSDSDWQSLEGFERGSYDLLKLINGKEWLLGETIIPEGRVSQVRLLLGDGTRLYTDDTVFVLRVPSGDRYGLKISVNEFLEGGLTYNLILDFDANKSIIQNGNSGNYTLKPVIRGELALRSGSLRGRILPGNKQYRIIAGRGEESFTTYTTRDGEFLLRALKPGIYQLSVPNDSGIDLTINEIAIRAGEIKDLGDLRML